MDVPEVADCLLDGGQIGERAGILLQQALELHDLMLIDDANKHGLFFVGIAADGADLRDTVAHGLQNCLLERLGPVGDDLELDSLLEAAQHDVADLAGDEAIEQAEDHRLIFHVINKKRAGRDERVDDEHDPENVLLRAAVLHERGHEIRSARRAAAAENDAVAIAADDAPRDRREDQARAVLGVIGQPTQIQAAEHQQRAGEDHRKDRRFDCEFLVSQQDHGHKKRDVEQVHHVTGIKFEDMLDHRRDTGQTGRGELIRKNKNFIAQREQNGGEYTHRAVFHPAFCSHGKFSLPHMKRKPRKSTLPASIYISFSTQSQAEKPFFDAFHKNVPAA